MAVRRLNDWVALKLSAAFFTMGTFWTFLLLAFLPLLWPASLTAVQFLSSGVIQLVALPLLGVSSIILGRAAEARAKQDHEAIMEEVQILRNMQADMHRLIYALNQGDKAA